MLTWLASDTIVALPELAEAVSGVELQLPWLVLGDVNIHTEVSLSGQAGIWTHSLCRTYTWPGLTYSSLPPLHLHKSVLGGQWPVAQKARREG